MSAPERLAATSAATSTMCRCAVIPIIGLAQPVPPGFVSMYAETAHAAATRDRHAQAVGLLIKAYETAADQLDVGKPAGYVISHLWTAHARANRVLGTEGVQG